MFHYMHTLLKHIPHYHLVAWVWSEVLMMGFLPQHPAADTPARWPETEHPFPAAQKAAGLGLGAGALLGLWRREVVVLLCRWSVRCRWRGVWWCWPQ